MQKRKQRPFTVIQGKQAKKGRKHVFKLFSWLLIGIVVFFGMKGVWIVVRNIATKMLTETVIAYVGTLEQTLVTEGVLAREERVVAAPASGAVHWLVKEGDRLATGSPVATIITAGGKTHSVTTPVPGIVVLQLDGFEGVLQPGILENIDVSELLDKDARLQGAAEGSQVQQGSLLFKVVNNFAWYYVVAMSTDRFAPLKETNRVNMHFTFAKDVQVQSHIEHVVDNGDETQVTFKLQSEVPRWTVERFTTAEIITNSTIGIILPASALIIKGEETGVYILDQSLVRYRAVEVLETSQDQVVIRGIQTGLPVITTPAWVREGQKI